MVKDVKWNFYILEEFNRVAMLSDFEYQIMYTRIKGMTISQQALKFHCSESKINKTIAELKRKYDSARQYSDMLPVRRSTKEEEYLDTH